MISVVIPVYNMVKYLEKSVECLLNQDYSDYEIIIVDDGSTDGSADMCDIMSQKSTKIHVIHQKNGGLSAARNTGIDAANGDYIIFPDPDDWVESNYLSVMIDMEQKDHKDLQISNFYITTEKGEYIGGHERKNRSYTSEEALHEILIGNSFCGFAWNKLYHMEIIRRNSLKFDTELGMAQDLEFAIRYLLLCKEVSYSCEPTYHYFQESGGVTSVKTTLTPRKISGLKTYEKIAKLVAKQYPKMEKQAYCTLFNMSTHFLFIYMNNHMDNPVLYKVLRSNQRKYIRTFLASRTYSFLHKGMGLLAIMAPRIYCQAKNISMKVGK